MADECSSPQNDGGEFSGSKLKSSSSSSVAPSTRLQRNQAEKKRRDRLNSYISELANIVPMVNSADKTLDKVSILRLSAAYLRLNKSCLHPKRFKSKMVSLPSLVLPHLDLIEKSTGGFVIVTTFTGVILYCSNSVHDYLGYQNIDVIGNSIYCYVHKDDSSRFERKMNNVISYQKKGKKRSKVFKAHVQQKPIPRSNDIKFRKMVFKLSVHVNGHAEGGGGSETSGEKKKKICRTKDFGTNAIVLMFVEPIKIEPEPDAIFIDSHQEGYFTMHGLRGEILYADQRITTITGYTSTDVKGKSAYEYIFSSDVPIALFAQKDMFSSQNGTGIITYRLRVKNLRYVYLQSKGQTVYKQDTKTLSHFVCFNKLLSDEEGREELKKFQERFAPQAMAANALTSKHKEVGCRTFPDEVLESTVPLFNNSTSHHIMKKLPSSTSSVNANNSHSVPCNITAHTSSNNLIPMGALTEAPDLVSQSPLDTISSIYSAKDSEATISNYDASSECSIIFPQSSSNSSTINSLAGCSPDVFDSVFENCLDTSLGPYQSDSVQNGMTQNLAVVPPVCQRQVVPQNVFTDIFPSASNFEGLPKNSEFLPVRKSLNSVPDITNISSDPFEFDNFLNVASDVHRNIPDKLLGFVSSNDNVASNTMIATNYMNPPSKAVNISSVPNENNFSIHKIAVSQNKEFYRRELNNRNISPSFTQSNIAIKNCQTIPLNELHLHPKSSDFSCIYSENIQKPADCISVPRQSHNAVCLNVHNGHAIQVNGSKNKFSQVSSGVIDNDTIVNNSSLPNEFICSSYSATTMVDDEFNLLLDQSYDIPTKRKKVEIANNICSDATSHAMSNSNLPHISSYVKSNEYQSLKHSMISSEDSGKKSNENSLSNELYYELDMFFQKLPNSLSSKFSNNDAALQNYNKYNSTSHCTSASTARNSNSDLGFLSP